MFEKFRQFIDNGKNMLEDAFVVPDDADFVAVPPGVTEEQLIEEAKQYVDAIIVESRNEHHHQNLVGVNMDKVPDDCTYRGAGTKSDDHPFQDDSSENTNSESDDRSNHDNPEGHTTPSTDSNNEQ